MEGSREQNRRDDDAPEAGLTGTLFQRRLATALATRPHARSLGTNILGASPLRTGLSLGWRRKRTLEREGFDTTVAPGGVLDADELIHVHGRRLPRIMSNTNLIRRRQDKELRPMDGGSTTGSLRRVTVSEADRRRGAVDWDRLCVDTSSDRADDNQHIDVLIAPIGSIAWIIVSRVKAAEERGGAVEPTVWSSKDGISLHRPERSRPAAPDDDPEFLRGLEQDIRRRRHHGGNGDKEDGGSPGRTGSADGTANGASDFPEEEA